MGARRASDRDAAPMQSSVHWALLGLVIERPSYGYELAQRFERAYGGMLRLSGASYVYTALDALQRRSMIEEIPATREGRQPKTRYRATTAGIHGYQERLIAQMQEDRARSRLLVRQLAVFAHEPDIALGVIERYEQSSLEEVSKTPLASHDDSSPDPTCDLAARLDSEENRLALVARLSWVKYARREFQSLTRGRAPRR
jgi:DNA-binding PadR family transcriptional regulator